MTLWQDAIERYRGKGVLVDANLLLLYFVGRYDRDRIETFKRTNNYSVEAFDVLAKFLRLFSTVVTTPNILTEVSNLSKQLPPAYYDEFKQQLLVLEEKYVSSRSVCASEHFRQFGLTDSIIVELGRNQFLVLTDDLDLFLLLQRHNIDVVNFNHIRFQ